jgi:hypothetical protein
MTGFGPLTRASDTAQQPAHAGGSSRNENHFSRAAGLVQGLDRGSFWG